MTEAEREEASDPDPGPEPADLPDLPAEAVDVAMGIAPHPERRVDDVQRRLKELDEASYGTKERLWACRNKAEAARQAHLSHMAELERRRGAARGAADSWAAGRAGATGAR